MGQSDAIANVHVGRVYPTSHTFAEQVSLLGLVAPATFAQYIDDTPQATYLKIPPLASDTYVHPRIDYILTRGGVLTKNGSCGTMHIENLIKGVDHRACGASMWIPRIGGSNN